MKQQLTVRVYCEDTDFSGRVYHASYLRFMERVRTEWLRALGFENAHLAQGAGIVFVVRSMQLEFLAPAVMDDLLEVTASLSRVRGAILEFDQEVRRRDEALCRATVAIVTMRGSKPVRPPRSLLELSDAIIGRAAPGSDLPGRRDPKAAP
jgi:acyl-CoA thioester hydrolase